MGRVSAGATMSLDGYIAGPNETGFDLLFQWYENGEVEIPTTIDPPVRDSEASAAVIKKEWGNTGALPLLAGSRPLWKPGMVTAGRMDPT